MVLRFDAKTIFFATVALLALAACGSTAGLNAVPESSGAAGSAGGAAGYGGGTTIGSGGNWGTTSTEGTGGWTSSTVTSGGGWDQAVTVGSGGYGGSSTTTVGSGGYGGSATTTVGSGGYGGQGVGGAPPVCGPGQSVSCRCITSLVGVQVCQPNGIWGPCMCPDIDAGSWEQQQLARLRRGIVGTWVGVQTNPWTPGGCNTTLTFEANGHYSAHSPGESCVVFYYGSNADSPAKKYVVDDVLANGEGHAEIEFWFESGITNRGELRRISLSEDENVLTFEAWKTGYGPIVFSLKRLSR